MLDSVRDFLFTVAIFGVVTLTVVSLAVFWSSWVVDLSIAILMVVSTVYLVINGD